MSWQNPWLISSMHHCTTSCSCILEKSDFCPSPKIIACDKRQPAISCTHWSLCKSCKTLHCKTNNGSSEIYVWSSLVLQHQRYIHDTDILYKIHANIDKPKSALSVWFTVFSKAFDHIDHTIAITKFLRMGVPPSLVGMDSWLFIWLDRSCKGSPGN